MAGRLDVAQPSELLERDGELQRLAGRLRQLRDGRGGLVLIEGSGGLGKTAFLESVVESAAGLDLAVCEARATEFEQAIGFGVVRQLFEPLIRACDDTARARAFAGAAGRARPIVTTADGSDATTLFAVLHGLYWLLVQLSADTPMLLVVDDAQWADEPSRAWLDYLQVRLEELPVLVLVATRPPTPVRPHAQVDSATWTDPAVERIDLGPLGEASVARLLARRAGHDPSPDLAAACHHVTGGNPFLVRELLDTVAARGLAIDEIAGDHVTGLTSDNLVRRTRHRLARLGTGPTVAANALAILGDGAHLQEVAYVADLEMSACAAAMDTLVVADLVEARPARFVHPLIQAAVVDSLAPYERSSLHARAAETLMAAHADPERVALHLLASEPAGRADRVAYLRRAAAVALHHGAPASGAIFLRRALVEPAVGGERADVLRELAEAELVNRDPAAIGHLKEALSVAVDSRSRAVSSHALAKALLFRGSWDAAVEQFHEARAALADDDPDLAARIEADLLTTTVLDDRTLPAARPDFDAREIRARTVIPSQRAAAITMALLQVLQGRCEEVPSLVRAALADGEFLATETSDAMAAVHAVDALVFVDHLDDALELARAMVADGERRGSVLGVVAGLAHCGLAEQRLGALVDAEADCQVAFDLAQEHDLFFTLPFIASYLATALLARGDRDRARVVIDFVDPGAALAHTVAVPTFLEARGAVRLAWDDRPGAIADLRGCEEAVRKLGITNPNAHEWRFRLVDALRIEDPGAARRIADENLELAVRCGSSRARGIALRCLADVREPPERVDLLRQSVDVLASSPARIELARSLLDLGETLCRHGDRAQARSTLLESLQIATECGATALAERALDESRRAGARPRRPWSSGAAALTPAERRVARLAAEGRTNQEIAQALFVTTKTVKAHLGAVYRKLSISSRAELSGKL